MTVHQIRASQVEDPFEPTTTSAVAAVVDLRQDDDADLVVQTGHTPVAGFVVRLEHWQLDPRQARDLAMALTAAADLCDRWSS